MHLHFPNQLSAPQPQNHNQFTHQLTQIPQVVPQFQPQIGLPQLQHSNFIPQQHQTIGFPVTQALNYNNCIQAQGDQNGIGPTGFLPLGAQAQYNAYYTVPQNQNGLYGMMQGGVQQPFNHFNSQLKQQNEFPVMPAAAQLQPYQNFGNPLSQSQIGIQTMQPNTCIPFSIPQHQASASTNFQTQQFFPNGVQQQSLMNTINNSAQMETNSIPCPVQQVAVSQYGLVSLPVLGLGQSSTLIVDHLGNVHTIFPNNGIPVQNMHFTNSQQVAMQAGRILHPFELVNNQAATIQPKPIDSIDVDRLANLLEKKFESKLKPIDTLENHMKRFEENQKWNLENAALNTPPIKLFQLQHYHNTNDNINRDRLKQEIVDWNSDLNNYLEPRPSTLWNNNSRNIFENKGKLRTCPPLEYENAWKNSLSPIGVGPSTPKLMSVYQHRQLVKPQTLSAKFNPFLNEDRSVYGYLKDSLSSLFSTKPSNNVNDIPTKYQSMFINRSNTQTNWNKGSRVILSKDKYYTIPTIDELDKKTDAYGQCWVKNFEVGHLDYGKVIFEDTINVAGLNLNDAVHFTHKRVVIYPYRAKIPSPGVELNQPAIITLYNFWPCLADGLPSKSSDTERAFRNRLIQEYKERLRDQCSSSGAGYIDFNSENGNFTFKIYVWNNN